MSITACTNVSSVAIDKDSLESVITVRDDINTIPKEFLVRCPELPTLTTPSYKELIQVVSITVDQYNTCSTTLNSLIDWYEIHLKTREQSNDR